MEHKTQVRTGRFMKGFLAGLLTAAILLAGAFGIRYVLELTGGDYTGGLVSEEDVQDKLDKINDVISKYYLWLKGSTRGIRHHWEIRIQHIMMRSQPGSL